MRREYDLLKARLQKADQPSLKVGMHVNIRFIQDNGGRALRSRQKPNSLEPHLESVTHQSYFSDEILIAHLQVDTLVRNPTFLIEGPNLEARPILFSYSLELAEVFGQDE